MSGPGSPGFTDDEVNALSPDNDGDSRSANKRSVRVLRNRRDMAYEQHTKHKTVKSVRNCYFTTRIQSTKELK